MKRLLAGLASVPLQAILVASFSLVAAATIGVGALATSRVISDYLAEATSERVARDMHLAQALYDIKLSEIAGISYRLALDPLVTDNLPAASKGAGSALAIIDQQIGNKVTVLALGGSHFIAVLNGEGDVLAGRLVSAAGEQSSVVSGGNWSRLPIVQTALRDRRQMAATEVIPVEMLAQVGLVQQARIQPVDTPKAALVPFDPREGSAGLALVGVSPILDVGGKVIGTAVAFHLFSNDFTLVDRIKEVAGIDTVTIFFGDMRVSTNVQTQDGRRAVGTRMSREVSQVILEQGREYTGPAFVVNEDYITRYEPLRDHGDQVVGSLYVGVRLASFTRLVSTFNERVVLIALATIVLAFLLAIPVSRWVTEPVNALVAANRQVAQGDMTVRVPVHGTAEFALLSRSFNSMIEALWANQLAQQEKLASLGQLAAGVAHEINNPLGTVLLYADILRREPGLGEQERADLDLIVNETRRCKSIVAALLNFSRQSAIMPQKTDLNRLILSVVEVQQKHANFAQVPIVTELDPSLPAIQADPAQLRQVLINLTENAAEAMPEGGRLTVRTRSRPSGMVTVEVQDTGVGIPAENLSRLFTPFFTTKPFGQGTGLGLAIVYGIIKMHSGQISAQSQVGEGTTLTFSLPIQLPEAAPSGGVIVSG